jgi:uncharacterized protein DUF998
MQAQFIKNLKLLSSKTNFWIAILAGLVYSSWPLGFILNPSVAHHSFASEFEAAHQPYNWLFIALDILSGLLMLVSGIRQWRRAGSHKVLQMSIITYVLFGVLVITAAIMPYNCVSGTSSCQELLHSPAFIIHGFSSIVSVVFLFISLILPTKILMQRRMYRWLTFMAVFIVAGWGFMGLGTLDVMAHGMRSNWLQYNLITVCSVSVVLCVALVDRLSGHPVAANVTQEID